VALADGLVVCATTGGTVCALQQTDGAVVWTRTLDAAISASGAISGSFYFVGTLARSISALRLSDGGVAWSDSLPGRVKTAPAVAGGRLVIATDDRTLRSYREEAR
jgi:outer membrane protein assembly factor BamB